ncbi:MAG TPA: response regulator [Cellvibrio sp.]|nr:response regulator [Cellvibrio sp.]
MSKAVMNILLVEDDDVAAEAVVRSIHKHDLNFPVIVAEDGLEALDVLRDKISDKKINRPYLILLDLNMPRMNGFEFLQEIRTDNNLKDSVVFVLTTSDADSDKTRAYHENIAGYMVKSAVGPQFSKLAKLLNSYHDSVNLP